MQIKRVKWSVVLVIGALEKELAEIDAEIYSSDRGSAASKKEGLIAFVPGVASINARSSSRTAELGAAQGSALELFFETTVKNWCLILVAGSPRAQLIARFDLTRRSLLLYDKKHI
jgi:hypothetical protein